MSTCNVSDTFLQGLEGMGFAYVGLHMLEDQAAKIAAWASMQLMQVI